MLQRQVMATAVTQCLTSSGSTLTIKEILQHDIKKTIHASQCFKKQLSHGLLVNAATLSANPKQTKQNTGDEEGGEMSTTKTLLPRFPFAIQQGVKQDNA